MSSCGIGGQNQQGKAKRESVGAHGRAFQQRQAWSRLPGGCGLSGGPWRVSGTGWGLQSPPGSFSPDQLLIMNCSSRGHATQRPVSLAKSVDLCAALHGQSSLDLL